MKKTMAALLAVTISFSLAACGSDTLSGSSEKSQIVLITDGGEKSVQDGSYNESVYNGM